MKDINWEEFTNRPLIGANTDEKFIVTEGDELVTFVKNLEKHIDVLRIGKNVNYVGCSTDYVYQKINSTISALEWMRDRIAETQGEVINCANCGEYRDLGDDDLCHQCSDNNDEYEY